MKSKANFEWTGCLLFVVAFFVVAYVVDSCFPHRFSFGGTIVLTIIVCFIGAVVFQGVDEYIKQNYIKCPHGVRGGEYGEKCLKCVEEKQKNTQNNTDAVIVHKQKRNEAQDVKAVDSPFDSPIESIFWYHLEMALSEEQLKDFRSQYDIGPYRADFAIPNRKVVIEIDGRDYHTTVRQRTYDY